MRSTMMFATLVIFASTALAASGGPLQTLKQKNGEVDRLLRVKSEPGSSAEKKQKDEIKSLAGTLLDYTELAKRALGAHWDKLTKAQRDDFVATLKELIERNYVRQLKSNLDYDVQYKNEDVQGAEATVNSVVKVRTEGKSTDVEIVYKLRKAAPTTSPSNDRWMVYDVITDEVSLVRNYRSQFNKIISEKSYDELIKKMKSKLKEGI